MTFEVSEKIYIDLIIWLQLFPTISRTHFYACLCSWNVLPWCTFQI